MEGRARAAPVGRRADHALARVLRDRRAARARLLVRLPAALHEPLVGGRASSPTCPRSPCPSRSPSCSRPTTPRPACSTSPSNRWIDAPKVEKRLIDTAPPGVDTRNAHDLLHQLVRAQRLQVPRLLEDRRARPRHRPRLRRAQRRPQDRRLGRHHARRRGDRPRPPRRPPRLVLRPLRRSRGVGRQLRHHQRRTSTATASPTTGSRSRGSTATTGPGRRWRATSAR